jgi:hypothetical protein
MTWKGRNSTHGRFIIREKRYSGLRIFIFLIECLPLGRQISNAQFLLKDLALLVGV